MGIGGRTLTKLSLYNEDWIKLFSYLMTIDAQPIPKDDIIIESEKEKKEEIEQEEEIKKSVPISPLSSNKQEITYRNYHIIIVPLRGDVIIREMELESQTIIRKGVFKEDDYYSINEEGRIFNKTLEKETPFILKIEEKEAILQAFDGINNAGFSIHIYLDIPSDNIDTTNLGDNQSE